MNLLRVILICFAIYFIRRIYQLYKFVQLQKEMLQQQQHQQPKEQVSDTIEAEYKVID